MPDFRTLSDSVYASPQITPEQIEDAATLGVTMIINNRPDGEEPGQPEGASIEEAARAAGLAYAAIPVSGAGLGMPQVEAMADALAAAEGKVLAYCRSGTRSTFLWSLAQAKAGQQPETIAEAARSAGYDVSPVYGAMQALATGSES